MPYSIIENFKAGQVANTHVLSARAGSLLTAYNVHITQSGEIEKREDIALLERYPITAPYQYEFFGLLATVDKLYTFGSKDY